MSFFDCERLAPNGGTPMRIALLGLLFVAAVPAAAETCHTINGQFGKVTACVSSVLPGQGGNSYGPEHLFGLTDGAAWCEGVPGPGIGETITLRLERRQAVRTLSLTNGYAKNNDTFRANGRIRRAIVETDRGVKTSVSLKDTAEPQTLHIPKATIGWVRLTIVEVFAGDKHADTCVTGFSVDLEEFGN